MNTKPTVICCHWLTSTNLNWVCTKEHHRCVKTTKNTWVNQVTAPFIMTNTDAAVYFQPVPHTHKHSLLLQMDVHERLTMAYNTCTVQLCLFFISGIARLWVIKGPAATLLTLFLVFSWDLLTNSWSLSSVLTKSVPSLWLPGVSQASSLQ